MNYEQEINSLRARVESLERQNERLKAENRKVEVQPAVTFNAAQADEIIKTLERTHATLDKIGVPR